MVLLQPGNARTEPSFGQRGVLRQAQNDEGVRNGRGAGIVFFAPISYAEIGLTT